MRPRKQRSKWEMLDHWELTQYLRIIHLDHPFVDLGPSSRDTGNVEENGRVFPEWTAFDVVDEADG